ncbi:MAG: hypothetical protein QNJ98_01550 [Planctomycetota bacterium]|nr:hypothetical protein [Planctomycetota bacterium]
MTTRRIATVLLACAGVLLLVGTPVAEAGRAKVTERHRDPNHKFSFKYFQDWKPIPLQPNERDLVCKFGDVKGKGRNRNVQDPTLVVHRMRVDGKEEEVVTGGPQMPRFRGQRNPAKDIWEKAFRTWTEPRPYQPNFKPLKFDRKEFKKVKTKKEKLEGKLYRYDAELPTWGGRTMEMYFALAVFEKDGIQIGIFFTCPGVLKKDFEKPFESVAKSFVWFDSKAEDVETRSELDGVNITAKRRREIEKGIVAGWDVVVSPKKNYIVLYNTKKNTNHKLAKEIAKRIEKIREQIYEVQFPPSKPITAVSIVRVCADAREYHQYGGPGGSAGYWSPGTEELVFYDASRSKKIDDDTVSVLYHEAFHQYIFYSVGSVSPHSWFNEGHGDYYAGAKYNRGKFTIGPFRWRVGVVRKVVSEGPREYDADSKTWGRKGYTPIKHLVQFTQGEYYSYSGPSYAQGWSLIFFLREIVPKNKKWNAKWGHILDTYFDVLKAEVAKRGDSPWRRVPMGPGNDEDEKDDGDDPFAEPDPPEEKDGKGKKGDKKKDADDEEDELDPETRGVARPATYGSPNQAMLTKALKKAFTGIDWDEFEQAWLKHHAGR